MQTLVSASDQFMTVRDEVQRITASTIELTDMKSVASYLPADLHKLIHGMDAIKATGASITRSAAHRARALTLHEVIEAIYAPAARLDAALLRLYNYVESNVLDAGCDSTSSHTIPETKGWSLSSGAVCAPKDKNSLDSLTFTYTTLRERKGRNDTTLYTEALFDVSIQSLSSNLNFLSVAFRPPRTQSTYGGDYRRVDLNGHGAHKDFMHQLRNDLPPKSPRVLFWRPKQQLGWYLPWCTGSWMPEPWRSYNPHHNILRPVSTAIVLASLHFEENPEIRHLTAQAIRLLPEALFERYKQL